ncbi:MAG: Ig-like domain-containing protein [Bacteroidales bacterium]|nr:Ig-like domain-containing protein [Bacteroidales bacterium]
MKNKLFPLIAFLLAFAFILISCGKDDDDNTPTIVSVVNVTLNQADTTLGINDVLILTATILPNNATNKTVSWESSDTTVVTVANGKITAIAQGSAIITVTTQDGNKTATCAVTVDTITVTSISLNQRTVALVEGATHTLTATIFPVNATNKTVIWTSSNTNIATVTDGTITAISVGSTTIIATTQDGSKADTCSITVTMPNRCNINTPGWGSSLGIVSFATTTQRTIFNDSITQIWSDAVRTTNCNKTNFAGGSFGNFNADCRSNPDHPGDLFSWCAIIRFQDQLCPGDWRVPTRQDFIDLDIVMGGTGSNQTDSAHLVQYIGTDVNQWAGTYGGFCYLDGSLSNQGSYALYWSQADESAGHGGSLYFTSDGYVNPRDWGSKFYGFTLRCIR